MFETCLANMSSHPNSRVGSCLDKKVSDTHRKWREGVQLNGECDPAIWFCQYRVHCLDARIRMLDYFHH